MGEFIFGDREENYLPWWEYLQRLPDFLMMTLWAQDSGQLKALLMVPQKVLLKELQMVLPMVQLKAQPTALRRERTWEQLKESPMALLWGCMKYTCPPRMGNYHHSP